MCSLALWVSCYGASHPGNTHFFFATVLPLQRRNRVLNYVVTCGGSVHLRDPHEAGTMTLTSTATGTQILPTIILTPVALPAFINTQPCVETVFNSHHTLIFFIALCSRFYRKTRKTIFICRIWLSRSSSNAFHTHTHTQTFSCCLTLFTFTSHSLSRAPTSYLSNTNTNRSYIPGHPA